jgi:HSP20 family molecular chaperone IbpA
MAPAGPYCITAEEDRTMSITSYRPTNDPFASLLADLVGPSDRKGSLMRASADVMEKEDEIRVLMEMPGMKAENVEIELENNVLTISGEKKEERTESDKEERYHLSERRYGHVSRSFVLPREVEQEKIQAHFEDGVLTVRIPKSEKARRRRIEIQNGSDERKEITPELK